jgi:signal peptidase I
MDKKEKEPWFAVILSGMVPGLGQFYIATKIKGIIFFCCIGFSLVYGLWNIINCEGNTILGYGLFCIGYILQILNMVDAFLSARKDNSEDFEKVRQRSKDPFLSVFLSSLLPGLGHVYARKRFQGLLIILTYLIFIGYEDYLSSGADFYLKLVVDIAIGVIIFYAFKITIDRVVYFKHFRRFIIAMVMYSIIFTMVFYIGEKHFVTYGSNIGNSNSPTLLDGDIILRDIYKKGNAKKGDIVAIKLDPLSPNETIGKRIIASEGETIEIKMGTVFIDGSKTAIEPTASIYYTTDSTCLYACDGHPYKVPPNCVFVLGDNNELSYDSRHIGPVKKDQIIGVTCKILWPLSRVRKL